MTTPGPAHGYQFGAFWLDSDRGTLLRDGQRVALSPKSFETLLVLVDHAGSRVSKDTLLSRVWAGAAVEENSVAKAISEVRRALGDNARSPQFVVTLSGHGYRFAASVARVGRAKQSRRIAVLPFTQLGGAHEDDHLAVGLADSLITRLSRLQQIVVRPTRTILPFASGRHHAIDAGRQLEVDCVLDGTIRRAGDNVRVSTQLVDLSSGAIAWADTFDEPFSEMFSLEDSITERVVAALAVVVTGEERRSLSRRSTTSLVAYERDLRGRFHLARRTANDCRLAIESFEHALDADPGDALAHSGIAEAYLALGIQALVMGGLAPSQAFPRAKAALERALRLDPDLPDAHTSAAQVSFLYDWQPDAAERSHRRALSLDPNGARTQHAYAMMLTFASRHEAAFASIQRARELDPFSPIINTNLGRVLYNARRYDEAIEQLQWTVRHVPDSVIAHYRLGLAFEAVQRLEEAVGELAIARQLSEMAPAPTASLAYTYAIGGRRDDARRLLDSLLARAATEYVAAPCIAEVWLALGDHDRASDWFDRAVAERSNMLATLQTNHRYDAFRDTPRFRRLVESVGLWRSAAASATLFE
jgi:TolB-like protein/tetratricopeptide (TPR) repeat protein